MDDMSTGADPALLEQWDTEGYLLPDGPLLPTADQQRLQTIFAERLAGDGDAAFGEMDMPHTTDARLLDILLGDAVLDVVEPIVGPDIALWSSGFICKMPRVGPPTPWHADSEYWRGRLERYRCIVTVWLAIDDVDRGNGCMRVIPGSHRVEAEYDTVDADGFFPREAKDVDESAAVHFERRAGQYSLHDGRILHGATANTSDRRRAGFTMRYLPASTRVVPEANEGHRIWLARGRPGAGNAYVNV